MFIYNGRLLGLMDILDKKKLIRKNLKKKILDERVKDTSIHILDSKLPTKQQGTSTTISSCGYKGYKCFEELISYRYTDIGTYVQTHKEISRGRFAYKTCVELNSFLKYSARTLDIDWLVLVLLVGEGPQGDALLRAPVSLTL